MSSQISIVAPSPLMILLEIHCFPYRHQCSHLNYDENFQSNLVNRLLKLNLIEQDPRAPSISGSRGPNEEPVGWVVTEKGKAYIKHLCNQPLPTQTWGV